MNIYSISKLTDNLCKRACEIAYPEISSPNNGDLYFGELGILWKKNVNNHSAHKLHVKPTHIVQAAKELFRGEPYRFLIESSSWEEFEDMYRRMLLASRHPKTGYSSKTIENLEDSANILSEAENRLRNFTNSRAQSKKVFWGWRNYSFCPFCWRIAPRVKKKQERPGRCSIHNDLNSKDTRAKRRLKDYIYPKHRNRPDTQFKTAFKLIFFAVKKRTRGFHNTTQTVNSDIYNMVQYPTPFFDPLDVPIKQISTETIWSYFPLAEKQALNKGADINNFYAAIKALDDDHDPTGMRDKIHQAYARAPILAEGFLLNAEVWLQLEKTQKSRGRKKRKS